MTLQNSSNADTRRDIIVEKLSKRANSFALALKRAEDEIVLLKRQLHSRHNLLVKSRNIDHDGIRDIANIAARSARAAHVANFTNNQKKTLLRHLFYIARRPADINQIDEKILTRSGVFDENWYVQAYPDVTKFGMSPVAHYIRYGFAEGRWPNSLFDTHYYLVHNNDVLLSGTNPLIHYHAFGWKENRNPNAFFDVEFYLMTNPDVAKAGTEPMHHYLRHGFSERRETSPHFSVKHYIEAHPDINFVGENVLAHFLHT